MSTNIEKHTGDIPQLVNVVSVPDDPGFRVAIETAGEGRIVSEGNSHWSKGGQEHWCAY